MSSHTLEIQSFFNLHIPNDAHLKKSHVTEGQDHNQSPLSFSLYENIKQPLHSALH